MKKIALLSCIFILFGCDAKQSDIDNAKYNISPTMAELYLDEFYTSKNSRNKVYSKDVSPSFDPIQSEEISIYCATDLPLKKDHVYKDDGLFGSGEWRIKSKINVDASKYNLCFLNLLKKTELNRGNLIIFTQDFSKNDLNGFRYQYNSDLIESKINEIKKDGKVTIYEALELYKLSDSLKQKSLYENL